MAVFTALDAYEALVGAAFVDPLRDSQARAQAAAARPAISFLLY
jgi:hypothetical protein